VPSEWLTSSAPALGLSRAEMDHKLLQQARKVGATVLEDASVVDVLENGNHVSGVRVKLAGAIENFHSRLTIDATGRTRALMRRLSVHGGRKSRSGKARLIAFKTHLQNARSAE